MISSIFVFIDIPNEKFSYVEYVLIMSACFQEVPYLPTCNKSGFIVIAKMRADFKRLRWDTVWIKKYINEYCHMITRYAHINSITER